MYKITIEKITNENRIKQQWKKLTDDDKAERQYGYVECEEEVEESEKIYEQLLEDVNIVDVVKVVNSPAVRTKEEILDELGKQVL